MSTTTRTTDSTGPRSGVVVVDKPAGWTSHQVVGRVRRVLGTRKVGHAGTLDPMATGVLVLGVERATRLLGHLSLTTKDYRATIRLGVDTITDDAEGTVTSSRGADLAFAPIDSALDSLRGDILQVPSSVSAIKVDGVRSYARVRAGQDVALVARPVTVSRLDVLDVRTEVADGVSVTDVDVEVECSSGTYIRALARDLGAALGVGGHLTALRRTRVGPFTLASAADLGSISGHVSGEASVELGLIDISDVARQCFATYVLDDEQAELVTNGRRLSQVALPAATTALVTRTGTFLALYRRADSDSESHAPSDAVAVSVFTDSAS